MSVKIGEVETFPDAKPDQAQALKILEEAAEVYSAWENFVDAHGAKYLEGWRKMLLLEECSDVVQAVCNLIAALGVDDFTLYMDECRKRNEERGRLCSERTDHSNG